MPRPQPRLAAAAAITLLTLFALAIHGYHPYSEDGGLYLAGIRKLLDPTLYPHFTEFVTEHLRFSLFAPVIATSVRATHLPLPLLMFLLYLLTVWATLASAWLLATRLSQDFTARLGALSLLACWLVLPVAGTSLMLTDPYLTARSWSTPLTILALAWTLDAVQATGERPCWRSVLRLGSALAVAALLHPLMAAYALAAVLVLVVSGAAERGRIRRFGPWLLGALALTAATAIQAEAPPESANYFRIAMTRYYWFPLRWQWFEQLGLISPFLVLIWLSRRTSASAAGQALARAAVTLGCVAITVALLFCRAHLPTHLVARLQPLRTFATVYLIMIVLLGCWLGARVLSRHRWRWLTLYAVLGSLMFFVARSTYPASAQVELPFGPETTQPINAWERAFVWCAQNTPKDALFALDAHYITRDGEDAQTFRALALRSAVPDYSKDGGEASITPSLTAAWVLGQTVQTYLDTEDDATRLARLNPLGVTWLVLKSASPTAFPCLYRNEAVKVCRLPNR